MFVQFRGGVTNLGDDLGMNASAPEPIGSTAITAIVYYIWAAHALEMYVPSIRSCTSVNLRFEPIPTRKELEDDAEERITNYYARQGKPRPAGPVRLEFRVPREDELVPAAPPHPAGRVGYGVPRFGHIDPGYVRSPTERLPGTEPVECPANWFQRQD